MSRKHVFSGNPLDRGERERRDEGWISDRANDPTSKFLPMRDSTVLITEEDQPRLGWIGLDDLTRLDGNASRIFLGTLEGTTYFTVDLSASEEVVNQLQSGAELRFEEARAAAEQIPGPDAGMLAQARAQINWHKSHAYCSRCGHKSEMMRGGQSRKCPQCDASHFPRTDPVVIMVVGDEENNRCLLGQSRGRLSRMRTYSALAGFVDQAETIEEAVAREVREEAGIEVKNVRYHSSQPWPFPSSLMIGCIAEAATTDIHMDAEEMTDVRWFTRDDVLLALEGKNENLRVPAPIAIAHHIITAWATKEVF